jgi:hypothetical protein
MIKIFNMKKLYVVLFIAILASTNLFGQNNLKSSDDLQRIALATYIPNQIENLPPIAKNLLENKLNQIVTNYGMSGNAYNDRFIITSNINVITKDITPTSPSFTALTLEVTFYIGDGVDGKKFASTSISSKGVGETETKAYIQALKGINVNSPEFKTMIETGKNRIVEYYNSRCDFIISQAKAVSNQEKFEEAIYQLYSVPEVCKDCYVKCMKEVEPIYKKQIDKECKQALTKAQSIWAANQSVSAANEISEIVADINPRASCYPEISKLVKSVSARVLQLDKREWSFKLKQYNDETEIQKANTKAIRDIGVAFGNHQPKTIYNTKLISTWW